MNSPHLHFGSFCNKSTCSAAGQDGSRFNQPYEHIKLKWPQFVSEWYNISEVLEEKIVLYFYVAPLLSWTNVTFYCRHLFCSNSTLLIFLLFWSMKTVSTHNHLIIDPQWSFSLRTSLTWDFWSIPMETVSEWSSHPVRSPRSGLGLQVLVLQDWVWWFWSSRMVDPSVAPPLSSAVTSVWSVSSSCSDPSASSL